MKYSIAMILVCPKEMSEHICAHRSKTAERSGDMNDREHHNDHDGQTDMTIREIITITGIKTITMIRDIFTIRDGMMITDAVASAIGNRSCKNGEFFPVRDGHRKSCMPFTDTEVRGDEGIKRHGLTVGRELQIAAVGGSQKADEITGRVKSGEHLDPVEMLTSQDDCRNEDASDRGSISIPELDHVEMNRRCKCWRRTDAQRSRSRAASRP
jgi:hypothetical protein